MKKFWEVIKSHKKISIVVLAVLAICLIGGGVFFARENKKTPVMATNSSTNKDLTGKSDSKSEDKTSVDSEDSKAEEGQKSESQESVTAKDSADASNQVSASSAGSGASSNAGFVSESDTTAKANTKSSSKTTKNTTSNNGAKTSSNSGTSQKANSGSSSASTPKANTSSQTKTSTPSQSTQPSQPAQPIKPSGHYETKQVLVQAAYDEPVYETQVVGAKCNTCGQVFPTTAAWEAHDEAMIDQGDYTHGSYSGVYGQVQTGTKHHDAVYKTEQVWVQN
ncbi:MAG: hypothetical protein ACI4ET_09020 [Bilifractor sp.]